MKRTRLTPRCGNELGDSRGAERQHRGASGAGGRSGRPGQRSNAARHARRDGSLQDALGIENPGHRPARPAVLRRIPFAGSRREGNRRAIRHFADQLAYPQPLHGRRSARRHLQTRQLELHQRRRLPRLYRLAGIGGNRSRLRLAPPGLVDCYGSSLQGSGRDVFAQAGVSQQPGPAIRNRRFFQSRADSNHRAAGYSGLEQSQLGAGSARHLRHPAPLSGAFTNRE